MDRRGNLIHFEPVEMEALGITATPVDVSKLDLVGMQRRLGSMQGSIIESQSESDFREHPRLGEAIEEALRLQESQRYMGHLMRLMADDLPVTGEVDR
jgi:hypothetical protein